MRYLRSSKYLALFVGSQLRRNVVFGVLGNGIVALVAMASYPIYLKYLGLQDYGIWLALSAVLTLVQLGTLGITPAVTKYVSEALSQGECDVAESYVATALTIILGSAFVVATVVSLARRQIVDLLALTAASRETAVALVIPVAFLSAYALITQVPFGTLTGIGRTDQLSIVQVVGRAVTLLVAWIMLARGTGVTSLLWGSFLSQAVMHACCEYLIWRSTGLRFWRLEKASRFRMVQMLRYGSGVFGSSLIQLVGHPLNRILLSRFGGIGLLPHFEIAFAGSMQIRSLLATALQSLLPEFSNASTAKDVNRILRINRRAWGLIALTAPLYILLILSAPAALRLWLGGRFETQQVPCFRVMLLGSFVSLLGVPAYYYLLGIADVRSVFVSQVVQVVGTVGLLIATIGTIHGLTPLSLSICVTTGIAAGTWGLVSNARKLMNRLSVNRGL